MTTEEFQTELQSGKVELVYRLSQCATEIKRLKIMRKQIRLQIANQDGAIASALKLSEIIKEEMRDLKNEI